MRNQRAHHDEGANAEEDGRGSVGTSHANGESPLSLFKVRFWPHCEYCDEELCDTYDHCDRCLTGHDMLDSEGTKEARESCDAGR